MQEVSHAKSVRRKLLLLMYDRYMKDPNDMLVPEDFTEAHAGLDRGALLSNMYYLRDRGLAEVMMGYNPPMFAAARITATGIDMVEDRYEFDLRFPAAISTEEAATANVPTLMEKLVAEADFSALDGEARKCLLRDVQFLREEIARPAIRWRWDVIETVLEWIARNFEAPDEALPSLEAFRAAAREAFERD